MAVLRQPLAVALLISVAFAVLSVGTAGSRAASPALQMDLTQCPQNDPTVDPTQCPQSSQQLSQQGAPSKAPSKKRPAPVAPAPAKGPKPGTEVHTINLKTGKAKVQTSTGTSVETVTLDKSVTVHPTPVQPVQPSKPAVTTTGGAPLPSGSNPFTFISGDQALSQFAIPPFLVPIYVAAGRAYGVPWNVLASINQIETDFGRNLNISSAGAEGWMQFMPATWAVYGVDASGDGVADPNNPVDAIYAAARYLKASGAGSDLRKAIFSYNHATWYVDQVIKNAGVYGSLPPGLLAEGGSLALGRFPVLGAVHYGDDFRAAQAAGQQSPRGLVIHAAGGARTIATQNVTVDQILLDAQLANGLRRHDARSLARLGPGSLQASDRQGVVALQIALVQLSRLGQLATGHPVVRPLALAAALAHSGSGAAPGTDGLPLGYAVSPNLGVGVVVKDAFGNRYRYSGLDRLVGNVRPGNSLKGGAPVGTLPAGPSADMVFAVAAAGGAPVDPRPLVDGYRLQEAAHFFHAIAPLGGSPFVPGKQALQRGKYVFPVPANIPYTWARTDMGVDMEAPAGQGKALVAIGNAVILHIQDMGAFGPTWMTYRLLDGPMGGRTIFIGHSGPPLAQPGQVVAAGQPIIGIAGGAAYGADGLPGHFEIGWADETGTNTLASPHYNEGDVTAEGLSFRSFMHTLNPATPDPGSGNPLSIFGSQPGALSAAPGSTGKATKQQESQFSRELGKIANPRVNNGHASPGSVALPKSAAPTATPTTNPRPLPLALTATANGARTIDIGVPQDAQGDEAYAVGVVNGAARGWAKDQTVLLAHRNGAWRMLGPPRDAAGHVVNPALHAIGAVHGGQGYAVGDRGQVVSLNGAATPRLLPGVTRARLRAVAVRRQGNNVTGFAVGDGGTAVSLANGQGTVEQVDSSAPSLRSVAFEGDRVIAAGGGATAAGPALYQRSGSGWQAIAIKVHLPADVTAELTSVASDGHDLWVAGGAVSSSGEQPFAARLQNGSWTSFCAGSAALEAVNELGGSPRPGCDGTLAVPPTQSGPASDVAVTAQGAIVAVRGGAQLFEASANTHSFRPVPAGSGGITDDGRAPAAELALSREGGGWLFDSGGRMARFVPVGKQAAASGSSNPMEDVPWTASGRLATVAVAPDGDRVLALGGGGAAVRAAGHWFSARGFELALRDVVWAGGDQVWGISDTGDLVQRSGNGWTVAGQDTTKADTISRLGRSLGSDALAPKGGSNSAGLHALAFRSSSEGYAVGAGGLIERFNGGDWKRESAPVTANLHAVAAGPGGIVAAGDGGTLLQRGAHGWTVSDAARKLVGGQDFTAADALPDGTLLAAANGAIVQASGGDNAAWTAADAPPLAVPIERLRGYRDNHGRLHVLALVASGTGKVLLDGDSSGWEPVALPDGLSLVDMQLASASNHVWIFGYQAGKPVAAQLPLPVPHAAAPASVDAQSGPPVKPRRLGTG